MVQFSLIRRTISRTLFKKNRPFGKVTFFGAFLIVVFFAISYKSPFVQEHIERFFLYISAPFMTAYSSIQEKTSENISTLKGLQTLKEENKQLRQEVQNLKLSLQQYKQDMLLVESLKRLLNFQESSKKPLATVPVLVQLPETNAHNIIIGGIEKFSFPKNSYITDEKGLVGRLTSSVSGYGKVQLLTDLNSRVPIVTRNSSYHAIMAGHNDAFPTLEFIHAENYNAQELQEGEEVLTSAQGGLFAQNIPVGTLQRCRNEWCVKPHSDLSRSRVVSVFSPVTSEKV